MASAAQRAITRASYRGLVRAGRKLDSSPAASAATAAAAAFVETHLNENDATDAFRAAIASPAAPGAPPAGSAPSGRVLAGVRAAFRAGAAAAGGAESKNATERLLDGALTALAAANKLVVTVMEERAAPVVAAAYGVGAVIRNKAFRYRGVIIGRDETCRAGAEWIAATGAARLPHGTSQPFYHVLADVRDREGAQVTYVAQDNIELLSGRVESPVELVVLHPLLPRYFDNLRFDVGMYTPSATARLAAAATHTITQAARSRSGSSYTDDDGAVPMRVGSARLS